MNAAPNTWPYTPLTRSAAAALPVLIDAHAILHGYSPKASRISDRIANLLEQIIDCTGDVEAYANKWSGGMGLADRAREATREYDAIR